MSKETKEARSSDAVLGPEKVTAVDVWGRWGIQIWSALECCCLALTALGGPDSVLLEGGGC